MSSPIFDATFRTGRFRHEEPMTTDRLSSSAGVACDALELQLFDLVELARDTRSDKGGEAKWVHPRGALVKEFAKRIAALAQPDDALKTRFEEWAFTRGHRNFTKSEGGYLLPEIQKDWLAFKAGATTALPPDCPTDGVAARQGNGG